MLLFWALTAVTVSLPSLRYNVSSEGGHVLQFQPAGFGGGANRSLANRRVLWLSAKLPNDGCAESPAAAPGDWVALVNRGDCHFSFKAVKAEAAGACAVIIVDTAGGDNQAQRFPFTMCPYPGDAEVNIPVMLVAHTAGALLAKFAQDAAWANITIPPFPVTDYCDVPQLSVPWQTVTVMIAGAFLLMCMFSLISSFRRRAVGPPGANVGFLQGLAFERPRLHDTMSTAEVERLPSMVYVPPEDDSAPAGGATGAGEGGKAGGAGGAGESAPGGSAPASSVHPASLFNQTCSICLDDFEAGETVRVLPCRHAFHSACIDEWLVNRQAFCPVCKGDWCFACRHVSGRHAASSPPAAPCSPPFAHCPLLVAEARPNDNGDAASVGGESNSAGSSALSTVGTEMAML